MSSWHFNYFMKMSRDRLWWISEGSGISSSEGCPPKDRNVVCVEIKYYNFHSLWLKYLSLCQDSKLFSQINFTLLHDFSNRAYFLLFLCNIQITAILQELTFQGGILMNYFMNLYGTWEWHSLGSNPLAEWGSFCLEFV